MKNDVQIRHNTTNAIQSTLKLRKFLENKLLNKRYSILYYNTCKKQGLHNDQCTLLWSLSSKFQSP